MWKFADWQLPENYQDYGKFILFKVAPRAILAGALGVLSAALHPPVGLVEAIVFTLLFNLIIFYLFPPSVDTLYMIRKTGDLDLDDIILLKLLRASKDSYRGIYQLDGSLVIKSHSPKVRKYFQKFETHGNHEYDVFRQSKPIREFKEQYHQVLESIAWKYVEAEHGARVIEYRGANLDSPNP